MIYDLIIIGAGPAGMTAALFAARYKMNFIVLSKNNGGYMATADSIENYPGFERISGAELAEKMANQIKKLKVEIKNEIVREIVKKDDIFEVHANKIYHAKFVIIASGTERQKLGLENEDKFIGKGVSYCATCDAPFFKNKTVCVIGGSNSAVMSALLLEKYAKKIYLIYRGSELRADPIRVHELKKNKRIVIILNSDIKNIKGKEKVEEIILKNGKKIKTDGIFVEIGSIPDVILTQSLKKEGVKTDDKGYIFVDETKETNVKGLFAAGDCTVKQLRQIITACADGAIAAANVYQNLKTHIRIKSK